MINLIMSSKPKATNTKSKKKKAFISIALVLALAITGALAFLTARDSAENKFTVGNVKIELTEPSWDESNAQDIVSGQIIEKDPTITNRGRNDAYVYMMVEIPKAIETDIVSTDESGNEITTTETNYPLFSFAANEGWTLIDSQIGTEVDAYDYYLYGYNTALTPGSSATLFNEVAFANVTSEFVDTYADESNELSLDINVTGYAIQSDYYNGEANDASTAWELYVNQNSWTWPDKKYAGLSTLSFMSEDGEIVNTETAYAGTPVEMYFEPSLAKDGYTFDWVDEATSEVAYSGMPMPEEDTTLTASYTATGYGEEGSTFLEYTFWYTANGEFYAAVNDVFDTHPTLPTEIPYDVVIPNSITVTIKKGSASGSYNYYGVDSYGVPIVDDIMAASAAGKAYLAQFKDQTITVPVKGLHFSVGAFENAKSLVLSDSISRATLADPLERCQYLETIIFPYGMTQLTGSVSFYKENGQSTAFSKIPNLENIIFPNSIEYIAPNMFTGCNALTEVDIPSSLKEARCFTKCENLKKLNFQNLSDVFECSTDAYISSGAKAYVNDSLVSGIVSVPYGVKNIADWALQGNVDITEISFPQSVERIGYMSFKGCSNLSKVVVADSVTYIDAYAFQDCTSLSEIMLSSNLNFIGGRAFYNTAYYNNTDNWDNQLLYIDNYLISCNATNIYNDKNKNIIVRDGIKLIASRAFVNCNVNMIVLPDGITTIPEGCFVMTKTGSIVIPTSVTFIDELSFDGTQVSNIYYKGSQEQWNAIEISDIEGDNYTADTLASFNVVYNYNG